jgi:hypothetical protein
MKIFILAAPSKLRPQSQPFVYPRHNRDYGVEQDFYEYLLKSPHLLVSTPVEADWHYLPVYWTRWHLRHEYGKAGREELQESVSNVILDDTKTFTICQYDDGPLIDIGKAAQCLASRKSEAGIDIPLLAAPHRKPFFYPAKRYQASFIGRASTHPVRSELMALLGQRPDAFMFDGIKGSRWFVRKTLASWIALAPRGYGGSSFRFFEAMQLGVVPLLLGDIDTRPFKNEIPWHTCSFYVTRAVDVLPILENVTHDELKSMGECANRVYVESLAFGRWCQLAINELQAVSEGRSQTHNVS